MLPAEATRRERILWACLATLVGVAHDGHASTDRTRFMRLEAACRSFGVPEADFDAAARRVGFHYHRPGDCYLSQKGLAEAERDSQVLAQGNGRFH